MRQLLQTKTITILMILLLILSSVPVAFADGEADLPEVTMTPIISVEGGNSDIVPEGGEVTIEYGDGDLTIEFEYNLEETVVEAPTESSVEAPTESPDNYVWSGGTWGSGNNTYLFNVNEQTVSPEMTPEQYKAYCINYKINANSAIAYTKVALSEYDQLTDAQKVQVTAILNQTQKETVTADSIRKTQLALWYVVNGSQAPSVAVEAYNAFNLSLTTEDLQSYIPQVQYSNLKHTYDDLAQSPEGVFGKDGYTEKIETNMSSGVTEVTLVAKDTVVDALDGFKLKVTVSGTKTTSEYYVFVPVSKNNNGVYKTQPLINAVLESFNEEMTVEQIIAFEKNIEETVEVIVEEREERQSRRDRTNNSDSPVLEIVVEEVPQSAPVVETVEAPVVVPAEVIADAVPLGVVALPKTGEIPTSLFYSLGGFLGGIGVLLRRKK